MANRPSALKSLRRDRKRALHNKMVKSRLRTELNKFTRMVERGDLPGAESQVALLTKLYQRAADRNVLHSNHAARKQAQFQRALSELKARVGAGA
jgi:small subunit ribosomal protein S20